MAKRKPVKLPGSITPPVKAVMVEPRPAARFEGADEEDYYRWEAQLTTIAMPNKNGLPEDWILSPISALLGLPLQVTNWPSDGLPQKNETLTGLFVVVDPEDESFGKVKIRRVTGIAMLARVDGEDLCDKHVEALLTYVNTCGSEIVAFASEWHDDRVADAKQLVQRLLTPRAFGRFFAQHRAAKKWSDVRCPVSY